MSNDGRSAQLGSRMCVDGGWRARWVTQMFHRCAGSNRRRAAGGAGVLNSESRRVDAVVLCPRPSACRAGERRSEWSFYGPVRERGVKG